MAADQSDQINKGIQTQILSEMDANSSSRSKEKVDAAIAVQSNLKETEQPGSQMSDNFQGHYQDEHLDNQGVINLAKIIDNRQNSYNITAQDLLMLQRVQEESIQDGGMQAPGSQGYN